MGADNIPEGNKLCTGDFWEDNHPLQQQFRSKRDRALQQRMTAHVRHAEFDFLAHLVGQRKLRRELHKVKELKVPALRVGDQKVAEYLDARHRLELFRIDKIGVKRERIGLAE